MNHLLLTTFIVAATVTSLSDVAAADIYRYVNNEGVECFTDTPTSRQAVVILREKRTFPKASRSKVPLHLSATGIAEKLSTNQGRTQDRDERFLPVNGRITSLTGLRHDPIDGKLRHHNGVDIAVATGTPVKPAAPGAVIFSGVRQGYGNIIILQHADGTLTLYAHNSANMLPEGAYADKDTVIALTGSTGRSTGPHLHFEAWKDGENITSSYVAYDQTGSMTQAAVHIKNDNIRRYINADGSLSFTNIR